MKLQTHRVYPYPTCRYQIPETHLRPLLDRIYIHIEVPRVDYEKRSMDRLGETSESILQCIQTARDIQNNCFQTRDQRMSSVT